MLKEFRDFLLRGNLVELAVAVVVGIAFGLVIKSLVDNLITPLIGMVGGVDFSGEKFTINGSTFRYGKFINDVIAFVLTAAAVLFVIVKPVNIIMARIRKPEELALDAPTETALLTEIRDLLARRTVEGRVPDALRWEGNRQRAGGPGPRRGAR